MRPASEAWFRQNGEIGVRNVVQPTLTPVLPAGPSTGAAVIVAPGGGFLGLAIDDEGWQVARWLADHGIAAFVLKYRVLPTPASTTVFDDEFNRMSAGEKVSSRPPTTPRPRRWPTGSPRCAMSAQMPQISGSIRSASASWVFRPAVS